MSGSLRGVIAKLVVFTAFTLSVSGLLAAVIGNIQPFTSFYEVEADFEDATGLLVSDVVRIAGVDVGKVTGAEVTDSGNARVSMVVRESIDVPETARAEIRFRNLLGQRLVALSRDPDAAQDVPPLPKDGSARIPVDQTSPAFDLGVVFNNLQPTLAALDPEDANTVTRATVEIFRGREERVQRLVADLADLSQELGDRGDVAQRLIDNLDTVTGSIAERDRELRSTITNFERFLSQIAERSGELGSAVENLDVVTNGVADLVERNRGDLTEAISQLREILSIAAAHKDDLDQTIEGLSGSDGATHGLNRATTYGETTNLVGVCVEGICSDAFTTPTSSSGLTDIFDAATGES